MKKALRVIGLGLILFALQACSAAGTSCTVASSTSATDAKGLELKTNTLGGSSIAQSFQITQTTTVTPTSAFIKLARTGTFATGYTLTLTIESGATATGGGYSPIPNGTSILATGTYDPSRVSTTASNYTFTFTGAQTLSPGTTYWLKLTANYPLDGTNFVVWSAHEGDSGNYTGGQAIYETSTPGIWSDTLIGGLRDMVFSIGC